jgi:protein-tyrosine phosphatase
MIDLHCHLLPGVDDGPDTLDAALAMCRVAVADGITCAVVTPHIHPGRWPNDRASIARACAALQHTLDEQRIDLRLGYAAEVRLTEQLMRQVENDQIPFYGELAGYRVMLLEFPHSHVIPGSMRLVHWLMARKIRPLIAHPERNRQIMKDPDALLPFVDAGCWLQLTAGSVLGDFGARARTRARQLLDDDLVFVLASDGHNAAARRPVLRRAFEHIGEHYGEARAQRLLQENPARISASQFAAQLPAL